MSNLSKILHWVIFLAFLGLVLTAISANVLFSKEAIMQSFSFSLPAIDIEMPPTDQLFVARIERRFTWMIHFWIGAFFMATVLLRFLLFWHEKRKRGRFLQWFTFALIGLMFLSGFPLFIRIYFDIPADVQQISRSIHATMAWVMGLFVIVHIAWVIVQENGKQPGIVSRMFQFKGKLLLLFMLLLLPSQKLTASQWQTDPDYQRAMAYMEGKIGTKESTKTIKNCPYAKCDKVADRVDRNIKTINIKTKNYPRMVAHFIKSLDKGNPLAAKALAKFLIGRIDYRSKVSDPTLIKIGERDTGMAYKAYLKVAQRALTLAAKEGDCYSMYKLAQFKSKGWLGFKPSNKEAQFYYGKVLKKCDKNSFFYIMSKAKFER